MTVKTAAGYQVSICEHGHVHIELLDTDDKCFAEIVLTDVTAVNELGLDLQACLAGELEYVTEH